MLALGPDFNLVSEHAVQQSKVKPDDLFEVRKLDGGALDNTVPPYVVEPWSLKDGVSLGTPCEKIRTVIVDFGSASTFEDINDGKHTFPIALRPPELVLGIPMLGPQAEIWTLGCIVSCNPINYFYRKRKVRFPFGHGLSYTTLSMSDPRLSLCHLVSSKNGVTY